MEKMKEENKVNEVNEKSFDFDRLLQTELGEFGLYQQIIVWLLCLPACFLSAYNTLDMVFLAYTPKHKCNSSILERTYMENMFVAGECEFKLISNVSFDFSENFTIPECNNWIYDEQYFKQTLVNEWNLVCDRALIIRNIISFINCATFFSMILSVVQDRLGRKRGFLLNLLLFLIGNCSALLSPNVYIFAFLKFIGGISCMWGICLCWALEFVGPNKRALVTTIVSLVYAFATASLALLGYLCDTWKQLGLCTTVPFVILFTYAWIIPESPRWLLSQGRTEEALVIIEKMAKFQKIKLDLAEIRHQIAYDNLLDGDDASLKKSDFYDFFRSSNLRWKTFLITFATSVGTLLYVAVPFHIEQLEGDFFLSFVFQAAVEAPATLCALFLLNRYGRVVPFSISMFLAGIACIATWPAEALGRWSGVILSTIARFFICTGIPISSQLANELFPTVARGMGNSFILIASNLLLITIQYVLHSSTIWKPLPMLIMGPVTMIGAVVTLYLPETKGLPFPDTVEEAERQGESGWIAFKKHLHFINRKFK